MTQIDSIKMVLDKISEYPAAKQSAEVRKEIRRVLNDSQELLDDLLVYLEKYAR